MARLRTHDRTFPLTGLRGGLIAGAPNVHLKLAERLFLLGDRNETQCLVERPQIQSQLASLAPSTDRNLSAAADLLGDCRGLCEQGSLERRKRLLHAMLENVFLEGDEICAITPHRELYPMFAYGCGPDGDEYAGDIRVLGPAELL